MFCATSCCHLEANEKLALNRMQGKINASIQFSSIHFSTTYPTRGGGEPGGYHREFGHKAEETEWGANTFIHYRQVRGANQPTMHVLPLGNP